MKNKGLKTSKMKLLWGTKNKKQAQAKDATAPKQETTLGGSEEGYFE